MTVLGKLNNAGWTPDKTLKMIEIKYMVAYIRYIIWSCVDYGNFLTGSIGESLFTFFASLAYVPLFLLELQNRLFWVLKELHKISFV